MQLQWKYAATDKAVQTGTPAAASSLQKTARQKKLLQMGWTHAGVSNTPAPTPVTLGKTVKAERDLMKEARRVLGHAQRQD